MAISVTEFTQDPAYAPFLGAAVGEDVTGKNVSVLSMLARLDVDPWVEATDLAHMQDAPARQRLEGRLTRFTEMTIPLADQGRVATALLALLPRHAKGKGIPSKSVANSQTLPRAGVSIYWVIGTVLVIGWAVALAQGN